MSTSEDSSQKAELDKVAKTSLLSSRCPHQFPSVAVLVFLHQFYLHRFFVLTRCLCLSASPSSYACIELKCRTVYSPLPLPFCLLQRGLCIVSSLSYESPFYLFLHSSSATMAHQLSFVLLCYDILNASFVLDFKHVLFTGQARVSRAYYIENCI